LNVKKEKSNELYIPYSVHGKKLLAAEKEKNTMYSINMSCKSANASVRQGC